MNIEVNNEGPFGYSDNMWVMTRNSSSTLHGQISDVETLPVLK